MVSIIITYHNEGLEFLWECVTQVQDTIDIPEYEIIIVDDFSEKRLPPITGIKIIRNETNLGVGQSFDKGVASSTGDTLILMACDMRFISNKWASKLVKDVEENQKSLICTACVGLNPKKEDGLNFEKRRKILRTYGADLLIFHDSISNPKKDSSFKGVLEAKWMSQKKDVIYEIPCILGACYGVRKEWYVYIDGFWGHKQWGTLEPYISLKSWLFGGDCKINPSIETAHIFKEAGSPESKKHGITQESIMFNKILVTKLLFDDNRLITFLGNSAPVIRAGKAINKIIDDINKKKVEYKNKTILSINDYCSKFNIDLRLNK